MILSLAVMFVPPPADAAGLLEGLKKYEAGDYSGAIGEWQPLADQGNPDALFNLGQVYRLGRGVVADAVMATEYYRRAADAGHAGARGALATLYYFDHGSRQKRGEAIALWRQAAAAGDAPSQYALAILYFNGQDVPRDLMQAYAWALLSAEGGMAEGQEAEQSIRGKLSLNQIRQARVLKGGLLTSPLAAQPAPATQPETIPITAAPLDDIVRPDDIVRTGEVAAIAGPAPEVVEDVSAPVAAPRQVARVEEAEALPTDIWSVQLGFYRGRDNAAREWDNLAHRVESLAPGITSSIVTFDAGPERGIFYRLMAGSFDGRGGADALCNSLKAIGIDCLVKQQ